MASEQILLVEAEAKTRRMLQVSLEQVGYGVSTARDGAEALAQLDLGSPALVVCATDLPKLDGYGLVRRMKNHAEWSSIPVIFMIAGESIEDKIRGLELGVEEYLHKPVFVRELLGRVQVLLARRMRDSLSESAAGTRVSASLADLAPIDLFESMESGRQTGTLRIRHEGRDGEVVFERGEMVDARLKNLRGEEAVFRMLTWIDGGFEVELGSVDTERTIESKTRAVIEAGIRHAAEFQRLCVRLPALSTLLEVDGGQLVAMQSEIPDEINGILELVDGKRSIHDVLDESPFDDLSTLATLAKLASEGLLVTAAPKSRAEPRSRPGSHAVETDEEEAIYRVETARPPPVAARPISAPPTSHEDPREWTRDLREEPRAPQAELPGTPGSELVLDEEQPVAGANGDARERAAPEQIVPSSRRQEAASLATQQAAAALADAVRASDAPPADSSHPADAFPPAEETSAETPPEATPRTAPTGTPADVSLLELPKAPAVLAPAVLGRVSLRRMQAPMDDVSTYTWLRDLRGEGPPAAPNRAPSEPPIDIPASPEQPKAEEPPDDPLLSQTVKSHVDREELSPGELPEAKPASARIREEEAAPASDPKELSESGVSEEFFERAPPEQSEALDDAIAPSSRDEPVYLSPAQVARKERGKRIVAMVVGAMGLGIIIAVAVGLTRRDDPLPAASATAAPTETAPPPPKEKPVLTKPESAPSAAPSASAAEDDEELPNVEDPMKELTALANGGQYNKAIPMGKAAIKKDPENADAYYLLGQCYEAMGKTKEAREIYADCAAKAKKGQYLSLCQSSAPK